MNRRHLLQTLIGGGLTLALTDKSAGAAVPQTLDIVNGAASEIPFRNSSPGYLWKGLYVRFVWAVSILRSPQKVLLQAAVQSPAYFFLFKYNITNNIPAVTSGKILPFLWRTSYRGKWNKVNYVSEYLDLPAGTYVLMGQDETAGTESNQCSLAIRDPNVPGAAYRFVESQSLLGVGAENTETPFGPVQVRSVSPNEVSYLKGCVNESSGGQIVEVLYEQQYLLWKQKKPYTPTFTFAHHFHAQPLNVALNSKWYLLLKNPGTNPFVSTNSPVSLSYVCERWRRI
jgi:hypothetical protein